MTDNNRSAISVRGLRTRLGASANLGPLDLELAVGEHALLVGPSGCGKSSLLRILAGLLPTESGDISLFGQEVSRGSKILLPPRKRGIGFLFQGGALWPHMNVAAHLNFVLRCAAIAPAEWDARRAELLTQVGLEGFEDRRPGTLSGGEAQRIRLATQIGSGLMGVLYVCDRHPLVGEGNKRNFLFLFLFLAGYCCCRFFFNNGRFNLNRFFVVK